MQLMKLRARDDSRLGEWLKNKTDKYVSHDIQNEILRVMAHSVLEIYVCSRNYQSTFYTIMCDERPREQQLLT